MSQATLVNANEAMAAVAAGDGALAQWKYEQPQLMWSAREQHEVMTRASALFLDLASESAASDDVMQQAVYERIPMAREASDANNTKRAMLTLLSRATSTAARELVLLFLTLRVRVEEGDISEDEAAALALRARTSM